jgi:WD40 repeat protein
MTDPIRIVNDARLRQFASNASTNDIDLFATGSVDHTVKLWNSDGKNLGEFRGHSGVVYNNLLLHNHLHCHLHSVLILLFQIQ